jgi:hypothetical protein
MIDDLNPAGVSLLSMGITIRVLWRAYLVNGGPDFRSDDQLDELGFVKINHSDASARSSDTRLNEGQCRRNTYFASPASFNRSIFAHVLGIFCLLMLGSFRR